MRGHRDVTVDAETPAGVHESALEVSAGIDRAGLVRRPRPQPGAARAAVPVLGRRALAVFTTGPRTVSWCASGIHVNVTDAYGVAAS
ncbi:hypothetical protein GS940_22330 [Rhodococcus hoagii]|nr:hypothetical protein [Prescottella equi]